MTSNAERVTASIRFLFTRGNPSVYFESEDAFAQSEMGKAQTLNVVAIVSGHTTTLLQTESGAKRGEGSALICRTDTGKVVVLPNDGNRHDAEFLFTIDSAAKAFEKDDVTMRSIRNAIRTNLEHRKKKMIPGKRILYKRPLQKS